MIPLLLLALLFKASNQNSHYFYVENFPLNLFI